MMLHRLFWIAFYLLFGFRLASYFLHLRGGLTTHSLALVSIILFVNALRAKRVSRRGGRPSG
jgi:hypothetical protein